MKPDNNKKRNKSSKIQKLKNLIRMFSFFLKKEVYRNENVSIKTKTSKQIQFWLASRLSLMILISDTRKWKKEIEIGKIPQSVFEDKMTPIESEIVAKINSIGQKHNLHV